MQAGDHQGGRKSIDALDVRAIDSFEMPASSEARIVLMMLLFCMI